MKKILGWVIALIAILIIAAIVLTVAFVKKGNSNISGVFKTPTVLNAVTSTTTSSAIDIKGAKKVTLFLTTNIPTSGKATTTFSVTVSGDNTTYTTYNKLIDNVANTNAQNVTRVASKAYDATTTASIISLDLNNDTFSSFKVSATQTYGTGGVLSGATVKSLIEY
jgi:hypothetical protein